MALRDAPTLKAKKTPLLLLVDLDTAFVARCERAAAAHGAAVATVERGAEAAFATQMVPQGILIHDGSLASSGVVSVARELAIELRPVSNVAVTDAELDELIVRTLRASRDRPPPPRA